MPKGPAWLKDAIFYQIYPQSYFDSNKDGIGDLPGITAKLPYIKSIGCNALWLNPCFDSPFMDAGYDIRDYYKIAPRYGTNADMKRLCAEAHRQGLRVILDLVPGHTSIEHPWFKASSKAARNKYSNWYIWSNSAFEKPPLGVSMVHGYGERDGNYVTNFFWSQPAINYGFAKPDPKHSWQLPTGHPDVQAVRAEMEKVMRFWLDMGADGFRVDMASSLIKLDKGWKQTIQYWRGIRAMFDRDYPEAVLISEWSHPAAALKAGFHVDFMIHLRGEQPYISLFRDSRLETPQETGPYFARRDGKNVEDFSFFSKQGRGNIRTFMDEYLEHYRQTRTRGYISIPSGNHDIPRLRRYRSVAEMEVAFAFLLTMPGVPFIYYGDEIAMRYIEGMISREGGYPRTGARTPMQWDDSRNAGFSRARARDLYLAVDPEAPRPNVKDQAHRPGSFLNFVRRLIALRREHPALGADGHFQPVYARAKKYPFIYLRQAGREKFLIAVNPSGTNVEVSIPAHHLKKEPKLIMSRGQVALTRARGRYRLKMDGITYAIFAV